MPDMLAAFFRSCDERAFSLSSGSFPAIRVTPTVYQGAFRFSLRRRVLLAALGLCWIAPLLVAAWLRPSPTGFGTHRQLGLPPCTFVWLFGIRCPSCGMTTAWSHAVRGHWLRAAECNAGGAVLAAVAMLVGPWLLVAAARGKWFLAGPPPEWALAALALGFLAITFIDWFVRLYAGRS